MERKKASDFPQELLDLFDGYVHGGMSRRDFLDGAQKFAVGGVTAAALLRNAEAQLRLGHPGAARRQAASRRRRSTVPSPQGNGRSRAIWCGRRRREAAGLLVVHENRGLNPYIEDVARRLAIANFIAFAPDGLTSVGGYPGDDEKGAALFMQVDQAKMQEDFVAAADWLKTRPDCTGKLGAVGFCFGGGIVNQLAVRHGRRTCTRPCPSMAPSRAPPTPPRSRRRSTPNMASSIRASPAAGRPSTPR